MVSTNNTTIEDEEKSKRFKRLSLEKAIEIFFKKKYVLTAVLIAGIVIFKDQLLSKFESYFVHGFLDEIHANGALDVIFILTAILISAYLVYKSHIRYKPSYLQTSISIVSLLVYGYLRFFDIKWVYQAFSCFGHQNIVYGDIIFILLPFLLIHFSSKRLIPKKSVDFFIEDSPISNTKLDILNRNEPAKDLAKRISDQKFKSAFTVGVIGSWGSGKTSFLYLVKEYLDDETRITVTLNVSLNHDNQGFVNMFFKMLSISISKYDATLSDQFKKYGRQIVSAIDFSNSKTLSKALDLVSIDENQSPQQQFDNINNSLKRLNKQIIVIIDDIDRMNHLEILEILKLIRNTGSFSNTVYLVGLDKSYLLKTLNGSSNGQSSLFLQKYFQFEFILPKIDPQILRNQFLEYIKIGSAKNSKTVLSKHINSNSGSNKDLFETHMTSMRDVTSLSNSFNYDLRKIEEEVDLIDFLNLQILKLKYSSIYSLLSHNYKDFLTTSNLGSGVNFSTDFYRFAKDELEPQRDETNISKYISENKENLNINDKEIVQIQNILDLLFFPIETHSANLQSSLSIRRATRTPVYFSSDLLSGNISEIEFTKSFSKGWSSFQKSVDKWSEKDQESLLISRLFLQKLDTNEQARIFISTWFYLVKKLENKEGSFDNISFLTMKIETFAKQFNSNENKLRGKEVGEMVLQALENEGAFPFRFSRQLIASFHAMEERGASVLEMSTEKLNGLLFHFFEKFVDVAIEFKIQDLSFLYITFDLDVQRASTLFENFLKKVGIKGVLSSLIGSDFWSQRFHINDFFTKTYKTFYSFLQTQPDDDAIKEFLTLYKLLSLDDFEFSLPFEFRFLQPLDTAKSPHQDVIPISVWIELDSKLHKGIANHQQDFLKSLAPIKCRVTFKSPTNLILLTSDKNAFLDSKDLLKQSFPALKNIASAVYASSNSLQIPFDLDAGILIKKNEHVIASIFHAFPSVRDT